MLAPADATEPPQFADAVLCRGVSLDGGVSVLQSRRAIDRRQPRRAVLSYDAAVRGCDGDGVPRRAPATVPRRRLRAGADRRLCGVAQGLRARSRASHGALNLL